MVGGGSGHWQSYFTGLSGQATPLVFSWYQTTTISSVTPGITRLTGMIGPVRAARSYAASSPRPSYGAFSKNT